MSDRRLFLLSDPPETLREKLRRLLLGETERIERDGGLREHGRGDKDVIPIRREWSMKVVKP